MKSFRRSARPRHTQAGRSISRLALAMIVGGAVVTSFGGGDGAHAALVTTTYSYSGAPVPIPEAADISGTQPGAPAQATVSVAGAATTITDINLSIDGTACSNTAGSTTVGIDHSFVSDLEISLISPLGTVVKVIDNTGGSGNNFCQTVLNDQTSNPNIQTVIAGDAPFTGTFKPANLLSAFNGQNPNGNWQLRAQDFFLNDVGNIRAFSLIITTGTPAAVSVTKTASGTFAEGGSVTYTVVASNSGDIDAPDPTGDELTDALPPQLTLVSANSTAGTAVANVGTNTVTWNGVIPAHGSVTTTIIATVNAGTENLPVSNQASFAYDSGFDGLNDTTGVSDDPGTAAPADSTTFIVAGIPNTVTVEQAVGQADPTTGAPILFDVTFNGPVTGFDASDVVLTGAGAAGATATVTGSGSAYQIGVSGMTVSGPVSASVRAGAVQTPNGTPSVASTSTDNTVTFVLPVAPTTTTTIPAPTTTGGGTGGAAPTTNVPTMPAGVTLPATGSTSHIGLTAMLGGALLLLGASLSFVRRRPASGRR